MKKLKPFYEAKFKVIQGAFVAREGYVCKLDRVFIENNETYIYLVSPLGWPGKIPYKVFKMNFKPFSINHAKKQLQLLQKN